MKSFVRRVWAQRFCGCLGVCQVPFPVPGWSATKGNPPKDTLGSTCKTGEPFQKVGSQKSTGNTSNRPRWFHADKRNRSPESRGGPHSAELPGGSSWARASNRSSRRSRAPRMHLCVRLCCACFSFVFLFLVLFWLRCGIIHSSRVMEYLSSK